MKQFIVLVVVVAAAFAAGVSWSKFHAAAPTASAAAAPPEEKPADAADGPKVSHDDQGNTVVTLSEESKKNAGIVCSNPAVAQWNAETKGYGRVLDPGPLQELVDDLSTAQATASLTKQEWERQKVLSGQDNTSARAWQAAEAAARHDQLAVQAVRDRLIQGWGAALAGRADLGEFVTLLTARRAALVRVVLPVGENLETPPGARLVALSGQVTSAKMVGPVTDVDPQMQGQGFIFCAQPNDPALAPGQVVAAWLQTSGEPLAGVVIPRDAVVRLEGAGWVYVQNKDKGSDTFTRKKIMLDRPADGGWFVVEPVQKDDNIVVTGAQTLLSEELKAALSPD